MEKIISYYVPSTTSTLKIQYEYVQLISDTFKNVI